MNFLNGLFFYGVVIPISRLPFRVLYVISDGMYFILYRVIGYRKKVVKQNIANSFPHKSQKEHQQIMRDFYSHLCDLMVESIKVFTISEAELHKRLVFINPEFINHYYDRGQNVIMALGHINNWEMVAVTIAKAIKHEPVALFRTFSNPYFDQKMKASRSKFGLRMIPTRQTGKEFEKGQGLRTVIFVFDQSPVNTSRCHWSTFLHQDTGMNFGVEKYSKKHRVPIVYARINKIKRGYYTFEFIEAIDAPESAHGYITERIFHLLEQDINATPAYWLWSHKRWKNKRPAIEVPARSKFSKPLLAW